MTEDKRGRLRKIFTDRVISLFIRWWAAGAIYFFIGWGTNLGNQETIIDFAFTLGLVLGLFNILIVNPALRMLFNMGKKRPKEENTYWQKLSDYLVELIRNILIVFTVAWIYVGINIALVNLRSLPAGTTPLVGEPILFGVFYLLVFLALEWLVELIQKVIKKTSKTEKES